MRNLRTAIDPDAPLHSVMIPEDWENNAATAILQLCPEHLLDASPIKTDVLIANWLFPLCEQATNFTAQHWESILLLKQACPNSVIWKNDPGQKPGIVINLAAFASTETGFNAQSYRHVLEVVADTLRVLHRQQANFINGELPFAELSPNHQNDLENQQLEFTAQPSAGIIYLSNLDACLAQLGYDYDSVDGRDVACCLACFATLLANTGCGADFLPLSPDWNALPELATTAKDIWALASDEPRSRLERIDTSFSTPGNPADLLLESESCGLAPIFSLLREDGLLAFSTLARLAHKGLTLESALAAALAGESIIHPPSAQAHYAMHQALAGFVTHMPARPNPITHPLSSKTTLCRGVKKPLPPRRKGITQKASIAGRGLFLRTGEYEDGTLGEISITPTKENAMVKGLLESLSQAVSIGLQYGAPLKEYVSTFAYSRFGVAGTVEGDPGALYATSFLDYSFRALSDIYLHEPLADAPNNLHASDEALPMLPLDLPDEGEKQTPPHHPRNSKFKLVS
ncbi:TSCPD domain-containing protein [Commensalibacter oyaizuii]|uniref:ribonucleoside-diphosphate reductase n=1 Tax=Commensalibacter oyaizuii TaxID=3043873 RepID=A0ABT6Q1A8_9PROT|nr:vitamin B12-dependent ribonucleotide reductase [Commensalibacter sp. TBRC 16381]MDI2090885.1 vitamin B12-dependent ribonucleotide reductase [Commensalibacter sp. TBRC 16381]